jgi:hypothetical protein
LYELRNLLSTYFRYLRGDRLSSEPGSSLRQNEIVKAHFRLIPTSYRAAVKCLTTLMRHLSEHPAPQLKRFRRGRHDRGRRFSC